jgi:hypothetical protein
VTRRPMPFDQLPTGSWFWFSATSRDTYQKRSPLTIRKKGREGDRKMYGLTRDVFPTGAVTAVEEGAAK